MPLFGREIFFLCFSKLFAPKFVKQAVSVAFLMHPEPILIIGAGLGGLALAQALHRKQIPFRIFERDVQHGVREQGWAISLHPWMMVDICSAMRDDEAGLRAIAPAAPLDLHSEGVIYSLANHTRKELFRFGEGTGQPFVRVERGKFRNWLLQDVPVEWGKRITGYEEHSGSVTARFDDGTEARGNILVGADGISSRGTGPTNLRVAACHSCPP